MPVEYVIVLEQRRVWNHSGKASENVHHLNQMVSLWSFGVLDIGSL